MINRIKNKIKQNDNRVEDIHQLQEDQLALVQLYKMFPQSLFLPLTTWSISPREIVHICNEIIINDRKVIVEFGSGFSTFCIAQMLKVSKKEAVFITVESDVAWSGEMERLLQNLELDSFVKVVNAPIAAVRPQIAKKNQATWYDTAVLDQKLEGIKNVDVVIVDGPIGGSTPFARYSAIPYVKDRMSDDFAVFLDDASRPDEKLIGDEWKAMLGAQSKSYKRYRHFFSKPGFDTTPYGLKFRR